MSEPWSAIYFLTDRQNVSRRYLKPSSRLDAVPKVCAYNVLSFRGLSSNIANTQSPTTTTSLETLMKGVPQRSSSDQHDQRLGEPRFTLSESIYTWTPYVNFRCLKPIARQCYARLMEMPIRLTFGPSLFCGRHFLSRYQPSFRGPYVL